MWIKMHLVNSGYPVYIESKNICAIYACDPNSEYKGKTLIQFVGQDNNHIIVEETVDEVMDACHFLAIFK